MSPSSFLAIAKDPTIIPGVHHHCDEWCDYCLVTNRCLAFRCTAEHRRRQGLADGEPTFRSLDEAVAFTRSVAEAEGTSTPELDALVAEGAERAGLHTADPLAGAALEYARQVSIGFAPIAELVANAPIRRSGPAPKKCCSGITSGSISGWCERSWREKGADRAGTTRTMRTDLPSSS